ncbi:MAG TPA: tRNA dihydrouridine synthase DusB [Anaerolineae bacterium]|nr:tRNA dihydrouridine synthase DusB [Anaerolineae bacterium]
MSEVGPPTHLPPQRSGVGSVGLSHAPGSLPAEAGAPIHHRPQPSFYVRDVPVYGDLILSPMAGFSDLPFRLICREYGSAMSYTEFVSAEAVLHGNDKTLHMLSFRPSENPMVFQFFGSDEDNLEAAARRLEPLGPDILDLNMGCSVNNVAGRGAGAGLLRDPIKIGRIFARLTRAVSLPITGKIRIGWDDHTRNYREVARVLEDNGAALIAVHGRTKLQAYSGQADWDAIAEVKQTVKIPVIGNGDVSSVADIERIRQHTGCDAVMIGRAAIGNPWIFQRRERSEVDLADQTALVRSHLALMLDFYGRERGLVLFRKHVVKYVKGVYGTADLHQRMVTCEEADQFIELIAEWEARGDRIRQPTNQPAN